MKATTYQIVLTVLIGLSSAACQKSCGNLTESTEAHANDSVDDAKPKIIITGLDLKGLNDSQISSITKLFNEEICPCGCPATFAQCVNKKEDCKPASLLAEWAVVQLKEGAPENYLYKAISEEIGTGYLAKEQTIDTRGAFRKGNSDAPYTIVEFADFECPACKLASAEMKEFFNDNKEEVQIYFMHFPLSKHPNAERAAIAAEAAGKQGKFWDMHDLLFAHEGSLTDEAIDKIATTLFKHKDLDQFRRDLKDPTLLQKIKDHKDYGQNTLKLEATPTFMFNGRPYNLSSSKDGYQLRLSMEKARKDIRCE